MQKEPHKFAIVCARGLGDALISMVLAHNLKLANNRVSIFSSILCELKNWFPGVHILPYPKPEQFFSTFSPFDTVIAADHALVNASHDFGNQLIVLKENSFDRKLTMVENLQRVCSQKLSLPFSSSENGICPEPGLTYRKYPERILLHPTSSNEKKNWPPEKFIALAHSLEQEGFLPYFCVSVAEEEAWNKRVKKSQLATFPEVDGLARFIYESGYLIGNDSGLGHLASSLHIPTLSLFARKSYAHLWRPGWGHGQVVVPPNVLIGARMKQKYWKNLLSVKRVRSSFHQLREETLCIPPSYPKFL